MSVFMLTSSFCLIPCDQEQKSDCRFWQKAIIGKTTKLGRKNCIIRMKKLLLFASLLCLSISVFAEPPCAAVYATLYNASNPGCGDSLTTDNGSTSISDVSIQIDAGMSCSDSPKVAGAFVTLTRNVCTSSSGCDTEVWISINCTGNGSDTWGNTLVLEIPEGRCDATWYITSVCGDGACQVYACPQWSRIMCGCNS